MSRLGTLVAHSLRRVRTLALAMGVLLAAFQVLLILVARSLEKSNAFGKLGELMPQFARELMGPSFISIMSFKGIVCLGYFHLAVMGSLVALSITLATIPAQEIETGFIDLILSRPVARYWIITRSIIVVALCTAAVLVMMMAGTWTGLNALAPKAVAWPPRNLILSLALNLGLLMLCWSGIAMAIASAARRRGVAAALGGLLALVAFLWDYISRTWQPAESTAWLSPFHYYSPFDLVMGTKLPAGNLFVLGSIALAGFAVAYVLYSRRDISH